jgi:hypothetical protein
MHTSPSTIEMFLPVAQADMAEQSSVIQFPLLSLVDELLLNILEHVNSRASLQNLACTCSRLQALVEPFIYRDLLILSGEHAVQIVKSIQSRENRVWGIRTLQIRYPEAGAAGIETLNLPMKKMSQLRELNIESSCPNNGGVLGKLWGEGRIDCAGFFEYASQIVPGPNSRVQIPLQSCASNDNQLLFVCRKH